MGLKKTIVGLKLWLENYLMNRKQYVVVDNQASRMQFIKCGVPQGSVLGPVLSSCL